MEFPSSPSNGDNFFGANNILYKYDSTYDVWIIYQDLIPKHHWKFQEQIGNYLSDSGLVDVAGHYILEGATEHYDVKVATGKINSALEFEGSLDYMRFTNMASERIFSPDLGDFTVCMWIYIDAKDITRRYIFHSQNNNRGVQVYKQTTENIEIYVFRSDGSYFVSIPTADWSITTWFHIAIVYKDDVSLSLYKDGRLIDTDVTKVLKTYTNSSTELHIGADHSANYNFDGRMEDIRIYERALSEFEIGVIMGDEGNLEQSYLIGFPTRHSPIRHWKMQTYNSPAAGIYMSDSAIESPLSRSINGSNITTNQAGKINKCFVFNGTTAHMTPSLPTSAHIKDPDLGDFTISFWVYIDEKDENYRYIFDGLPTAAYRGFRLCKSSSGIIETIVYWSTHYYSVSIPSANWSAAEWFHVSVIYTKGTSLKIYKNTHLIATDTSSTAEVNASTSPTITIGRNEIGDNYYFDGKLEDIRIYDYALSDDELSNIFNSGKGILC